MALITAHLNASSFWQRQYSIRYSTPSPNTLGSQAPPADTTWCYVSLNTNRSLLTSSTSPGMIQYRSHHAAVFWLLRFSLWSKHGCHSSDCSCKIFWLSIIAISISWLHHPWPWPFCFMFTEVRLLIRDGDRGGRGLKSEGSTTDTTRKRPERPWTAARTMEVLRRCPLAIAQWLVHCTSAVSTAVLGRVTKTMSIALLLRNNLKWKKSNFCRPAPPPCSWSLLG